MSGLGAAEDVIGRRFDRRRPSLRLMRPFALVCGLGLLAVLLPPYDVSWVVLALAVVVHVMVLGLFIESSRALCAPGSTLRRPTSCSRSSRSSARRVAVLRRVSPH